VDNRKKSLLAVSTAAPIGVLGGLIGLGGAEFRLPVLLALFKYSARQAVVLNLAISLITVVASLIFRLPNIRVDALFSLLPVILSLIAGCMLGAYGGALYSKQISERMLEKIILILLVFIGTLLIVEAFYPFSSNRIIHSFTMILLTGMLMGIGIGTVSSLLGVAGGELIIPTLLLVFGVDIKLAGTASLIISLPTIIIGLTRHMLNVGFFEKSDMQYLIVPMGIGSVIGAYLGGLLLGIVSGYWLKIILGIILMASALKIYMKKNRYSAEYVYNQGQEDYAASKTCHGCNNRSNQA